MAGGVWPTGMGGAVAIALVGVGDKLQALILSEAILDGWRWFFQPPDCAVQRDEFVAAGQPPWWRRVAIVATAVVGDSGASAPWAFIARPSP
jgi:hypothetical protein